MTAEPAPKWIVVTRPDRAGLMDELAWRYRHAPWVAVLADRRGASAGGAASVGRPTSVWASGAV